MPFHPRSIVFGVLGVLCAAALLFAVAAGVPLGPALAAGAIAGGGYPFFVRYALVPVPERVIGLRAVWLFVITAGLIGMLLWVGVVLIPWNSTVLVAIVFFTLSPLSGLVAAKLCTWAARQFRRIDFEMSLPVAERVHGLR